MLLTHHALTQPCFIFFVTKHTLLADLRISLSFSLANMSTPGQWEPRCSRSPDLPTGLGGKLRLSQENGLSLGFETSLGNTVRPELWCPHMNLLMNGYLICQLGTGASECLLNG